MDRNVKVDDNGKVTALEFSGEMVPLKTPVKPDKLQEINTYVQWVEENLSLEGVQAGEDTKKWGERELRDFLKGRIPKKHNQLCFLGFLAQREDLVTKSEIDEMLEKYGDIEDWGKHSLGGMKGSLTNKINGKGKEKLWDDRKNSSLDFNEFRIKPEYQDIVQDVLSEYPKEPENGD